MFFIHTSPHFPPKAHRKNTRYLRHALCRLTLALCRGHDTLLYPHRRAHVAPNQRLGQWIVALGEGALSANVALALLPDGREALPLLPPSQFSTSTASSLRSPTTSSKPALVPRASFWRCSPTSSSKPWPSARFLPPDQHQPHGSPC